MTSTGIVLLLVVAVASAGQPGAFAQDVTAPHASPEPGATPAASNGTLSILEPSQRASALVDQLRGGPFGHQSVDAVVAILAGSGIGTYEAPDAMVPIEPVRAPESPIRLLADQARNMALEAWAGAGTSGTDTDGLADPVDGLVPASYLVAGYVATVDTPGADVARALMGGADLTRASELMFPQLVLTLFTNDVLLDQLAANGQSAKVARTVRSASGSETMLLALEGPVRVAQADLCTSVAGFLSDTLTSLFAHLRLTLPGNAVGGVLVSIWNFAVSVLEGVVRGLVRVISEPILQLIGEVVGAIGVANMLITALSTRSMRVSIEPVVTEKGTRTRPPDRAEVTARLELGGIQDWPTWIESCARAIGVTLPDLHGKDSPVSWAWVERPPGLIAIAGAADAKLDERGTARLRFTTLVDDVAEPVDNIPGILSVSARVGSSELGRLFDLLADEALDRVGNAEARAWLEARLSGVRAQARTGVERAFLTAGTDRGVVVYHVPRETPRPAAPTPQPQPSPSTAVWVHFDRPAAERVEAGRILELVACDGAFGEWHGFLRTGGLLPTASDPFAVPWAELPMSFTVPGVGGRQSVQTSASGMVETPIASVRVTFQIEVVIDGPTMSVRKLNAPEVDWPAGFERLPLEPAPARLCRR